MLKKNLVPLILIVLSLLMLIGSNESRLKKAGWMGNTVFFPFVRSLKAVETRQELKQEVFSLRKRLAETTLENLSLQNELKQYTSAFSITYDVGEVDLVQAEIIGISGQYQELNLIVDKGIGSGIQIDDPVISANGING